MFFSIQNLITFLLFAGAERQVDGLVVFADLARFGRPDGRRRRSPGMVTFPKPFQLWPSPVGRLFVWPWNFPVASPIGSRADLKFGEFVCPLDGPARHKSKSSGLDLQVKYGLCVLSLYFVILNK